MGHHYGMSINKHQLVLIYNALVYLLLKHFFVLSSTKLFHFQLLFNFTMQEIQNKLNHFDLTRSKRLYKHNRHSFIRMCCKQGKHETIITFGVALL